MTGLFLIIGYAIFALILLYGAARAFGKRKETTAPIPVSVIIPCHNEERNVQRCINSIVLQSYPKNMVEIIFVDDASTDNTVALAEGFLRTSGINYRILRQTEHMGKKKALTRGIEAASNELILTRDADTYVDSEHWLSAIIDCYTATKKEFIICPVASKEQGKIIEALQYVEWQILMLLTFSSAYFKRPLICSGANLCFTKRIFNEVGGYSSHLHIASGDDVLFMEDVKKLHSSGIVYCFTKESMVYTSPEPDLTSFLIQRQRWASKIFSAPNPVSFITAAFIVFVNLFWILFLGQILTGKIEQLAVFFVLSKLLIDILLVFLASRFVKNKLNWLMVIVVDLVYPFYTLLIALRSMFFQPKWKV